MTAVALFFAVQLLASGYALRYGGAPERLVAVMLSIAAIATAAVPWNYWTSFRSLNLGVMWIDITLLAGIGTVALLADRFWPLWLTALHLLGVTSHAIRVYDPELWAIAYFLLSGKIAYPMLALLAIGTFRSHERRRAGSREWSWTHQRARHERQQRCGRTAFSD